VFISRKKEKGMNSPLTTTTTERKKERKSPWKNRKIYNFLVYRRERALKRIAYRIVSSSYFEKGRRKVRSARRTKRAL